LERLGTERSPPLPANSHLKAVPEYVALVVSPLHREPGEPEKLNGDP
jgi:hypothetical protein